MNITRDVILDLLPLYLADEVSEDTRALVEAFLATDAKLAVLVEQAAIEKLPEEIPVPLSKEIEMKTFEKTKQLMRQQKILMGLSIFTSLMFIAFRGDSEGVRWLWADSPEVGWPLFVVTTIFWTAYLNISYQLNKTE